MAGAALFLGGLVTSIGYLYGDEKGERQTSDSDLVALCQSARSSVERSLTANPDSSIRERLDACESEWRACSNQGKEPVCEMADWQKAGGIITLAKGPEMGGVATAQLRDWARRCVEQTTGCYQDIDLRK